MLWKSVFELGQEVQEMTLDYFAYSASLTGVVFMAAIMRNDFCPNLIFGLANSMFTMCRSIKSLPITNS